MTRAKKLYVLTSLLVLMLFVCTETLSAVTTHRMSYDEEKRTLDQFQLQTVEEPMHNTFCCFSIGDNGAYALGFPGALYKTVVIYDANGEFVKRYDFRCDGDYGIRLEDEELQIYFARSERMISVSLKDDLMRAYQCKSNGESAEFWNETLHPRVVEANGEVYRAYSDSFLLSLFTNGEAKLVKTTADGAEIILHDASALQRSQAIFSMVIAAVILTIAASLSVRLIYTAVKQGK